MTSEEKQLWYDFLKLLPLTVSRQKTIGNYIVDFYISSKKLVIEIDGIQHQMPNHEKSDKNRDQELKKLDIRVLRYKNSDINGNFNAVCNEILNELDLKASDVHERK